VENITAIVGIVLLMSMGGVSVFLWMDREKLRTIISRLEKEKNDLADQLAESFARQSEILNVLKFVMAGEIRTARTEEREQIFKTALGQLQNIQREINFNVSSVGHSTPTAGDSNRTDISGGEVGQVSGGRGNDQTRKHE
jgi:hypothetical protein